MCYKVLLVLVFSVSIVSNIKTSLADEMITQMKNGKCNMPLVPIGEKLYYFGTYFKANWYRANQFCRAHGMHLLSINNKDEYAKLTTYITDKGMDQLRLWTSGNDLAEPGSYVWMGNGNRITFAVWANKQPDNKNNMEHCVELVKVSGEGMQWNNLSCKDVLFFICEVLAV